MQQKTISFRELQRTIIKKKILNQQDDNSLFSDAIGIPVVLFLFENLKHVYFRPFIIDHYDQSTILIVDFDQ